jgi:hypothetical protein
MSNIDYSWKRASVNHLILIMQESRVKFPENPALAKEYVRIERAKWLKENPEFTSSAIPATIDSLVNEDF